MADVNGAGSQVSTLMNELKGVVSKGQELVVQQARVGKLKLEILQLKRDKSVLFERLGQSAYQLLQEGRLPVMPEFERPLEVLRSLEEKIGKLEEEISHT